MVARRSRKARAAAAAFLAAPGVLIGRVAVAAGAPTAEHAARSSGSSALSAVLAWGLFVGIAVIGLWTIFWATRAFYRRLRSRGVSDPSAGVLAAGVGLLLGLGGWLLVDLYWLGRRGSRLLRATARPGVS